MKKNKFHVILLTSKYKEEYNLLGEYVNNHLIYYDNNKLRSEMNIDVLNKVLIKDNIDYKITLNFDLEKNSKGTIYLKKEDSSLELDIKTEVFDFSDNLLKIKYSNLSSDEVIEYNIEVGE